MQPPSTAREHRLRGGAIRAVDLALLTLSAPVWIPVLAAIGVCVVVASGRPVFFSQTRIGRDEKPFSMLKFRTMRTGPNPIVPDPDRITSIGRVLRRSSLDEFPQLLNVARGDMSLVGPRPMLPQHHRRLDTTPAATRTSVRPGMTGLAQVSGRNALRWADRIALDCQWATEPTVGRYVALLARTARVVVSGDGVDGHDADDPLLAATTLDLTSTEVIRLSEPATGRDDRSDEQTQVSP